MAERKVINKYYPPDFNPAKIPRRRQTKNYQTKIRTMLPMTICCKTCSNCIYRGTKFNSRKETVSGETYLGIEIFRFYFKCTKCSAEISIKTDPKNSDYMVEFGATRNFEPWRAEVEEIKKLKRKREDEEMGDTMKVLENKTVDSKREIDILGNLDEMRSMKARRANVSVDAMLEVLQRVSEEKERKLNEEDEAIVRSIFQQKSSKELERRIADAEYIDGGGGGFCLKFRTSKRRRLDEEQSKTQSDEVSKVGVIESCKDGKSFKLKDSSVRLMRVSVLKTKPLADSKGSNPRKGEENKEEADVNSTLTSNALDSLCQQYGVEED